MAYDLEEQEQIDEIKAWWKQYGGMVLLVITAALLTIAAFQGWRYYQNRQALAAVTLYQQLERAEEGGDHKKVRDIAAQIRERYASTAYAVLSALAGARAAAATGDAAAAREQLRWALENARDEETKSLARLRLARILLQEKNHAEALKLLESKPVESMTGLYADLRGDVLADQGKIAEARSAYQLALDKSDSGSVYRAVVQMKLDTLGEGK